MHEDKRRYFDRSIREYSRKLARYVFVNKSSIQGTVLGQITKLSGSRHKKKRVRIVLNSEEEESCRDVNERHFNYQTDDEEEFNAMKLIMDD